MVPKAPLTRCTEIAPTGSSTLTRSKKSTAATTKTPRLRVYREQAAASRAMNALDSAAAETGLEPSLRELIKLRASQINGCGYCIDMHW